MKTILAMASLSFLVAFAPASLAKVYKYRDNQGVLHFTDSPPPSADTKSLNLHILGSYEGNVSSNLPEPSEEKNKKEKKTETYKQVAVTSPTQKQTIHDNQGILKVSASVQPELHLNRGDRMKVFIDGQVVPPGAIPAVSMQVRGINRGKHTVHVAVVNSSGKVLKTSDNVTFYMHQASRLNP